MYGKKNDHAYHGAQKQVVPPPRIPGSIGEHRRDRLGWVNQPLQNEGHSATQNLVCHQRCDHGHYSRDCQLPYGR